MFFVRPKTFVLDRDTLADPKIVQFFTLGIVTGQILVPEIAPQPQGRRAGRTPGEENDLVALRARENLERLKKVKGLKIKTCPGIKNITDLIQTARAKKATILTIRPDVKSAANGVTVISAAELFSLFRPSYLPGTVLRIKITKKGKERNEGIGYLEGGVKVVVENCGQDIGKEIEVVVKGALDTDVGQVIFAQPRFVTLD